MKEQKFFIVKIIFFTLLLAMWIVAPAVTAGEKGPRFGGTLKASTRTIKSLDPIFTSAGDTRVIVRHIYDFLFAWDKQGEVQPMMVKDWKITDDLKSYSFTLREGLTFHNDQPVTSEDVIASLKRWGKKDRWGRHIFGLLKEMKKTDDRTFTIELKEPYGLLPRALGWYGSYLPVIMPKELAAFPVKKPVNKPIGSGPFRFVEWKTGQRVVLERFEGYKPRQEPSSSYAGSKIAYLDRIEFIEVPDMATRIPALETGELDFIYGAPRDEYERLQKNPDLLTNLAKPNAWLAMVINKAIPPFNNVKMRQALQAAVDVDEVMRLAIGSPEFFNLTPAVFFEGTTWGSMACKDLYNQANLRKAKDFVNEAGGPPGEPIIVMAAKDYEHFYNASLQVKAVLEKLGFKVDLRITDYATIVATRSKKEAWHMFCTGFTPNTTLEPANTLWMNPKWAGWYESPRMEQLHKQYTSTMEHSKQKKIADEMQCVFYQEVPLLRFGEYFGVKAFRKEVKGTMAHIVDPIFWNVWLDK